MVVNRGFSINWQNEAHQSHRGGMLHRQSPVRVTHCGESSVTCVSGTESCREGAVSLSLSLPPDSVSHHMWLSVDISPTHSDRLCFSLSHFKLGLAGILCQSRQRQDCQNTLLNFSFPRIFFADDMCWEACNSMLLLLFSFERSWNISAAAAHILFRKPWSFYWMRNNLFSSQHWRLFLKS